MAHLIEVNDGVASFVENGRKERAWHGLGQVFDGPMRVEEALELSHADYQVELKPVVAITPDIEEALKHGTVPADLILDAMVRGRMATMRLDKQKALGVVSESYGVVQNRQAFSFIDTLCSGEIGNDHVPVIETAGVLGHGERVFITAKFPEQIILDNKGDDRVEMYVVFTTSHDGTGAVSCLVTPIRVVCNNTLNFAMSNNVGRISLRHTSGVMDRLDLTNKENVEFAFRTLNMYEIYKKSLVEKFDLLQKLKLNEKWVDDILAEVLLSEPNYKVFKETGNIFHEDISTRGKNIFVKVKDTLDKGIGQDMGERGTGMWLINGLTSYFQNDANYKDEESKFKSLQDGLVANKVQKAYELLVS